MVDMECLHDIQSWGRGRHHLISLCNRKEALWTRLQQIDGYRQAEQIEADC